MRDNASIGKVVRKGANNAIHFEVKCFWCDKMIVKRKEIYERELGKYGHFCCKNCFGKEPSFRSARALIMNTNNPFKGQRHTETTKAKLRVLKTGKPAWNKGLTAETSESVRKCKDAVIRRCASMDLSGDKNPNWKGGVTPKVVPFTSNTKEWLAFRVTILKRDCFRCYKCNELFIGKELDVHHIASQTRFKDLKFEERNCITLCTCCHKQFHKEFGIKRFSPMDTIEWLNKTRTPFEQFITC